MLLLLVPIVSPVVLYACISRGLVWVSLSLSLALCLAGVALETVFAPEDAVPMATLSTLLTGLLGISFLGGAYAATRDLDGLDRFLATAGLIVGPPLLLTLANGVWTLLGWLGLGA